MKDWPCPRSNAHPRRSDGTCYIHDDGELWGPRVEGWLEDGGRDLRVVGTTGERKNGTLFTTTVFEVAIPREFVEIAASYLNMLELQNRD